MLTKLLEIRDEGTCIPAMATEAAADNGRQTAVLRRAGYNPDSPPLIILQHLHKGTATYNPYDWGDRTWHHAHQHIVDNWSDLKDGDVIDVQYILGETTEKKASEIQGIYA
jgi:hypothetical protein